MTKKQRKRLQGPTAPAIAAEKKIKPEVEKMKEEEEEEGTTSPEETAAELAAAAAAVAAEAEEMGLWGLGLKDGDVDEQMSWGSVWLPFWDVEFVGENYGALFNDVVWDDDIWNLRTVTEVPRHVVPNDHFIDRV